MTLALVRHTVRAVLVAAWWDVVLPSSAMTQDTVGTYDRCALSISPRWNGLAVVRGVKQSEVANLHFFWPRDISTPFWSQGRGVTSDSVTYDLRRALRLRRIGAALTDLGTLAVVITAAGSVQDRGVRGRNAALLGAAAVALGVSVPFQFAADAALSRAVWWHNRRYAN